MIEIIADLSDIDPDDCEDILPDHGVVQQVENALLDLAGNKVRIRITKWHEGTKRLHHYPTVLGGVGREKMFENLI